MKKLSILLMLMGACAQTTKQTTEQIEVQTINEKREPITVSVPLKPKNVALLDYIALDMMLTLGMEDKIVGITALGIPPHLKAKITRNDIATLGTLKEIDLEKLMSIKPDIIFASGRSAEKYDKFTNIAPTVTSSFDYKAGNMVSFAEINRRNAKILGLSEEVEPIIKQYENRVQALAQKAQGKTALVIIVSGGNIRTLGDNSRGSLITKEIGFKNLAADVDSTHGNSSSFELLLKLDPDYIFVLDRDAALATQGSIPSKDVIDNEIVAQTKAYKNNHIIYLDPSSWYLSEGGLSSMDIMLSDIEKVFK